MCLRNRGTNWGGTGGRRTLAGFTVFISCISRRCAAWDGEGWAEDRMGVRYNVLRAVDLPQEIDTSGVWSASRAGGPLTLARS